MLRYDFEENKLLQFLKRRKAKRAAVQLPDGLKPQLPEIIKVFEEAGVEPVTMGGSCYGACDLTDKQAARLGCDVLVHYGHADMGLPVCMPTLYIEARVEESPLEAVEQALSGLKSKRVGLLATVQYISHLKEVAKLLRSRGIQPIVGRPGPRTVYPGQILGCDLSCAKSIASRVDEFLYIGTGDFHPLGAALATGKHVVAVDPVTKSAKSVGLNLSDFLRKRKALVSRAAVGQRFGVVTSTKPGQARFKLATQLLKSLKRGGKDACLLVVDDVAPEQLENFGLDVFVCAACPRIPIDDAERFTRPIITPFETMVMLGKLPFEPYRLDEVRRTDFWQSV